MRVFCLFVEAFWAHFEVNLASNFDCFFDIVFGDVLVAFWSQFGRHLEVIVDAFSVQKAKRRETVDFQNLLFFLRKSMCFEGRRGPDGVI